MKVMFLVVAVMAMAIVCMGQKPCECEFKAPGGCVMKLATEARACKCIKTGTTCTAETVPCPAKFQEEGDTCAGKCISKACCEAGGGDCGGY